MKKILSVLLVMLTVFSPCAAAMAVQTAAETGEEYIYYSGDYGPLTYEIENGEVTITYCDLNANGEIEIPAEIDGYPVRHIGGGAFSYRQSVTAVTIPDSVETIGDTAFYYTNIETMELSDSIRRIEPFAFEQCDAAINTDYKVWVSYIPEGESYSKTYVLTYFGNHLIGGGSASCVLEVPEGTLCIMGEAFKNTSGIKFKGVNIPASVVNIGDRAFTYCENVEFFEVAEDNLYYSADENGVLYNKDKTVLISYPRAGAASHFTIPETVTRIEPYAFYNCANLTSVNICEGVVSIGEYAFYGCTNLIDIKLPDSLRETEIYAFADSGYYLDESNWENDILYIGNHLIGYNEEITSSIVTEIKDGTVSIAQAALYGFTNPLPIPESVKGISDGAFIKSNAPETVEISENVEYMGDMVFGSTETVKELAVDEDNPYYSSDDYGVLFNKDKTVLIDYPEASDMTEYTIPASVEEIANSAFAGCKNLKSVNFEENSAMISLSISAFYSCTSLESITLPETLSEIDDSAFSGCTSLKSVSIPENIMKINGYAFDNCTALETVEFSGSSKLRYLGSGAFNSCTSLKEIEIPEGVDRLRDSLFRFCRKLETITIKAADLVSISNDVFRYNDSLETICFYGTEEQWANVNISTTRNDSLDYADIICDAANASYTYTFIYNRTEYIKNFKYGETVIIPEEIDMLAVAGWSGDKIPETMPRKNLSSVAQMKEISKSADYDVTAYYSSDAFEGNITLSVAEIAGDREPGGVYMVEGEYYKQIGLYNIKAVNENSEVVQPNEGYTVTIKMAIPEAYKNRTEFMVYHRFTGSGREQLSTENGTLRVENGYLIFEVSQFSEFEIFVPTASMKISHLPDKTIYAYNEDIDLTGIRLRYTSADGKTKSITDTSFMTVKGFDSTKVGKQTVTVRYGQYTDTFEVEVAYSWWQWIVRILFLGFLWY